ncbi:MAG TPA: hypothetical protein VFA33_21400 [Bryobacteraceae bacterium]|nr:hypothetical protein [Bryobacteraceae bacterium]
MLFLASVSLVSAFGATSLTWVEDMPFSLSWKAMRIPKWSHGAVVAVQYANNATNPIIWIVERQRTYSVSFQLPGASSENIYDWDRSFDGTKIALSGSAIDADGRGDFFIAWISSDGTNSIISRTSYYRPRRIAIAPDGTLWTAGQQLNGPPDAGVFRHFDQQGKLLAAFVPQSSFPDPIIPSEHSSLLRVSKDRVAWYSPRAGRYIEISLQGVVLMDISVNPPGDRSRGYGFGLTDKGDAFLSSLQYIPPTGRQAGLDIWSINILNKSTAMWTPVLQRPVVRQAVPDVGHIYGVDSDLSGDKLVLNCGSIIKFYKLGN